MSMNVRLHPEVWARSHGGGVDMSRVVVLGAGISGHTAASFAKHWLGRNDTVTVISPNGSYNWVPSNIWVGVGLMKPSQVTFLLAPVYERHGIEFVQAAAREIHPEGDAAGPTPYVTVEPTGRSGEGANGTVKYDFLINATGPKLRFDKTEGLGPDGHSLSVCTVEHAVQTAAAFDEAVERMRRGERQGGHRLDHQRVRAGRLRHGWDAYQEQRLHDPQQHFRRVFICREGDLLGHPRPRPKGRPRASVLRDHRRARA
jgi:hypothetical protein